MKAAIPFVSLGPGDPELITLKAFRILKDADLVFCPATRTGKGETVSRAADLLRELGITAEVRLFIVPMERDRTQALLAYRKTAAEAAAAFHAGRRVTVTVEGDAGIYASIHYMMDFLEEGGVPTSQCCGIPSFIAAGGSARLQLASQNERLAIVPGTLTEAELDQYLATEHVVVVMKLSRCQELVKEYVRRHPEHTYHYFENVAAEEKAYHTAAHDEFLNREFPYFSLMIIHP